MPLVAIAMRSCDPVIRALIVVCDACSVLRTSALRPVPVAPLVLTRDRRVGRLRADRRRHSPRWRKPLHGLWVSSRCRPPRQHRYAVAARLPPDLIGPQELSHLILQYIRASVDIFYVLKERPEQRGDFLRVSHRMMALIETFPSACRSCPSPCVICASPIA